MRIYFERNGLRECIDSREVLKAIKAGGTSSRTEIIIKNDEGVELGRLIFLEDMHSATLSNSEEILEAFPTPCINREPVKQSWLQDGFDMLFGLQETYYGC